MPEPETSIQRLADRWAAIFVPGVVVLAGATVFLWSAELPFDQSLLAGLAVLVVACPCALGLAAPMATTLGIGLLGQRGCLVRSGAVLETLARIKGVAFDKTGTLTTAVMCNGGGAARSAWPWRRGKGRRFRRAIRRQRSSMRMLTFGRASR